MEVNDIYKQIEAVTRKRYDLLMSITNSPIEKIFFAQLYSFFYKLRLPITELYYDVNDEYVQGLHCSESHYYTEKLNKEKGLNINPLTGLLEQLSGFIVSCPEATYTIRPQLPISDEDKIVYTDFAIELSSRDGKVSKWFAIECDGFPWHSSKRQIESDNKRSRFLLKHGYSTIHYSGAEINILNHEDVARLENIMFQSVFGKESSLYKLVMY